MVQSREVVLTGVGVVSPIGIGNDAFWTSLRDRRSGVRPLKSTEGLDLPTHIGAEIPDFDAKLYVQPRKSLKVMCREIQTAFAASTLALEDAALDSSKVNPDRYGVVLGTEMFYGPTEELEGVYRGCMSDDHQFHKERWGQVAMKEMFPLWMLKYLPNMAACHIGIAQDARGPNNTIVMWEVSALLALWEAASMIRRDWADVMIAGAAGTRLHLGQMLYKGFDGVSRRNGDPAAAVRPFDADRDGMVFGEGAAAFILESRAHAEARGARLRARVLGHGSSMATRRPHSVEAQHAISRSISAALHDAQMTPGDVGLVKAHGSGTVDGDIAEAQAIHAAVGRVPVFAPSSYFGQLGAGGGAVELAAAILALEMGEAPVTLNYERPDPKCPVNVVHGEPLPLDRSTILALNQSTRGQASAAILAAP
jgi:3-oxoacyl-[acyl-carrier-protein] synthase II